MGDLSGPETMGHTGFTGTSIVVNPVKETVVILLTNKVHPTRNAPSTNPIRQEVAGKTAAAINAWNASTMKALVEDFAAEEAFSSDAVAHSLKVHLAAVSHYEDRDLANKVIKHMKGFKTLLQHQQENMSQDAYETLKTNADYLIGNWQ
jgi:CubicO group peptidase (beta-lactamase class C family)